MPGQPGSQVLPDEAGTADQDDLPLLAHHAPVRSEVRILVTPSSRAG